MSRGGVGCREVIVEIGVDGPLRLVKMAATNRCAWRLPLIGFDRACNASVDGSCEAQAAAALPQPIDGNPDGSDQAYGEILNAFPQHLTIQAERLPFDVIGIINDPISENMFCPRANLPESGDAGLHTQSKVPPGW